MTPRIALALAMLSAGAALAARGQTPADSPLNILFIVSDDLNTDLGSYGMPVRSPNIDRLAARGVRFERAYVQYPLCNPSRASFLTGRRPDVTGVLTNPDRQRHPMSPHFREHLPDTITLPQLFRNAGYQVARVGKLYHYGVPNDIGTASLDDYMSWDITVNPRGHDREIHDRIFTLVPGQFGGTLSWFADEAPDEAQTDGIGAREAVELLERFSRTNRPFFLAVGLYRPHTPFVAPKPYFDGYSTADIALPSLSADDRDRQPAPAYRSARDVEDAMTDDQRREAIRAYHASTTFMDAQVGLLLDALGRLNLTGRTVVVFTSDHGYHLGDHGLWQKSSLFERAARVPLIIAAPGAAANGRSTSGLVELLDVYPTLAELCGLQAPDYLDGTSLAAMLQDPVVVVKDAAYTQVRDGYAVRTTRWRYIEWSEGQQGRQLYDMDADPAEAHNLAETPGQEAVVADLQRRLKAYRAGVR
jgi:iduronate 2-sulfatase